MWYSIIRCVRCLLCKLGCNMDYFEINNRRYLGSKYKLIDFIDRIVKDENLAFDSFFDVFGGTGVVAHHFFLQGKRVIVNDILTSNYFAYISWFGDQPIDTEKILNLITLYNNLNGIPDNYFSDNFADTYFSYQNSKKIGFIREDIEKRYRNGELSDRERSYLITSLIYALDRIANTVGHYDAYRKNGDLNKQLELKPLLLHQNGNHKHEIYKCNSNDLVRNTKCDLAYIDPPYNSRQYSDAYHLLENITEWKKPEVVGVARKMPRQHLKSKYCTQQAPRQFQDLVDNLNAKYIMVSYNNMGNNGVGRSQAKISDNDILSILERKGKVKLFETEFNYFSTGKTKLENHKERIFLCKVCEKKFLKPSMRIPVDSLIKSPLNYTGGKYKLLPQLINKFPKEISIFVDVFSGGANVGVNIRSKKTFCIDNQREVINLLNYFKNNNEILIVDNLLSLIEKYGLSLTSKYSYEFYGCNSNNGLGKYNKEKFLDIRKDFNSMDVSNPNKNLLFLILIIYGFNNQIRFNSEGHFNLPVGKRDFNSSLQSRLKKFIRKIHQKEIYFIEKNFREIDIASYSDSKTFFYFDPPYYLGTATYNENDNWTVKDELDLLNLIKVLDYKNQKFALSNVIEHKGHTHDILINWALENKFNINHLSMDYRNSNYQSTSKNHRTSEVLITNY